MQIRIHDFDDFIVVSKGFGYRTHRVSDKQLGFVEYLSEKLKQNLFVVHRLDKETSGLMLFAKTKKAAQDLSILFETHQIKKTYFFLSDKLPNGFNFLNPHKLEVKSHIDKIKNSFVNKEDLPDNSETHFHFIKKINSSENENFYLWQANPITGKPHQIRLHALKIGMPILGDIEHEGSPYFRLALTAQEISFTWQEKKIQISEDLKSLFSDEIKNKTFNLLEECWLKRHRLFKIENPTESYRLIHHEGFSDKSEHLKIRADVFGDHLWIYDYTENGLTSLEKEQIKDFSNSKKLSLHIRHMLDRGHGVGGLELKTLESSENATDWTAREEGIHYLFKTDSGFSPGLFLDQRENRLWVKENSFNKNVLNLFAYTSGFSLNAAIGKAKQVTTVDVSGKFLDWSKKNFSLNKINLPEHEFFAQDTILFLKGSVKRGRKWDLIICDPPTFGRSKDRTWKLEKDLPELAELLLQCLNTKGQLLFTCNDERRTQSELIQLFSKKIQSKLKSLKAEFLDLPQVSLDYEHKDDKNLMKGFLLKT